MFTAPSRQILSPVDMSKWKRSKAFKQFSDFVTAANTAVKGKSNSECGSSTPVLSQIVDLLNQLDGLIDETPLQECPQRFGNKAFRDWHGKMKHAVEQPVESILRPFGKEAAVVELLPYLQDSFGNATRIDYGTGHEACYLMFLLCLYNLGVVVDSDLACLIGVVFRRYLALCQRLQITFRMEPAGSHGVYSLDDYQFLPFIFGSAQLVGHNSLTPNSFVQEGDLVNKWSDEFLFMDCVRYIKTVKKGLFAEHSNQLWNISGVPSWSKVNTGLQRMYQDEVLLKYPVVQHFVFGTLLSFDSIA